MRSDRLTYFMAVSDAEIIALKKKTAYDSLQKKKPKFVCLFSKEVLFYLTNTNTNLSSDKGDLSTGALLNAQKCVPQI